MASVQERLHEPRSYAGRDVDLAQAAVLQERVLREGDCGALRA